MYCTKMYVHSIDLISFKLIGSMVHRPNPTGVSYPLTPEVGKGQEKGLYFNTYA